MQLEKLLNEATNGVKPKKGKKLNRFEEIKNKIFLG
jgi:hypothetical protein